MKKHTLMLALTLPALALVAGCHGSSTNTTSTDTTVTDNSMMTSTDNVMPADESAANNATMSDATVTGQQFANAAASTDAYEIAAAKLAKEKATTQPLKDFAAMMIKDHTDSTAKLKAAAAKADPKITPDATLTDEQKANLETLRDAKGADFDAAYKSQQIAAHQKALGAMQGYASTGDVSTLKDFATSTSTVVQAHLDKIQSL
jgi:putative membrane protein